MGFHHDIITNPEMYLNKEHRCDTSSVLFMFNVLWIIKTSKMEVY